MKRASWSTDHLFAYYYNRFWRDDITARALSLPNAEQSHFTKHSKQYRLVLNTITRVLVQHDSTATCERDPVSRRPVFVSQGFGISHRRVGQCQGRLWHSPR